MFQKEFFGGDGNAKTRCVDTGVAANRIAVFPESRCLQREFNLDLIQAQMNVEETFAQLKEYDAFRVSLESTIHAAVHFGIGGINGGDMGTTPGSTNDPFFWIHHSNIDRCWAEWQGLSKKNLMSYGGLVDEKASKTSDQVPAGELQRYFVDGWNTKMIRVSDTFNWCNVKYE